MFPKSQSPYFLNLKKLLPLNNNPNEKRMIMQTLTGVASLRSESRWDLIFRILILTSNVNKWRTAIQVQVMPPKSIGRYTLEQIKCITRKDNLLILSLLQCKFRNENWKIQQFKIGTLTIWSQKKRSSELKNKEISKIRKMSKFK